MKPNADRAREVRHTLEIPSTLPQGTNARLRPTIVDRVRPRLAFRRYYNSRFVRLNGADTLARSYVAGSYWYADYFQKIGYTSLSGHSAAFVFRPDSQRIVFHVVCRSFYGSPRSSWCKADRAARRFGQHHLLRTLTLASDTVETYDADGKLLTIADRSGVTQYLAYDGVGQLVRHRLLRSSAAVHVQQWEDRFYHPTRRAVDSVHLRRQQESHLRHRRHGQGKAIPLRAGSTSLLTGITDEHAQRYATYGYHDYYKDGTSSELAGGINKYTIEYTGDNVRTVTSYADDSAQRQFRCQIRSAEDSPARAPLARVARSDKALTYDANGNITTRNDFKNNLTCYAYDLARNLEIVRVEGFASTITACPANLASVHAKRLVHANARSQPRGTPRSACRLRSPEANRTTSFTHDANGNVLTRTVTDTSVTPNVSRTWTYTYNSFGQVLTEDGPRTDVTDVTTYTYYPTCTTGCSVRPAQHDHERARPRRRPTTHTTRTASPRRSPMRTAS